MGSSGTGIGETFKKKAGITGRTLAAAAAAPFTGGASLATDVALSQMERKKKQAKERAQASQTRLQQEAASPKVNLFVLFSVSPVPSV